MLVRNLTPFPWGRLVTARKPPRLEMAVVVRGTFDVVPGGPCRVALGDPMTTQGIIGGEVLAECDEPGCGAPLAPNDLVPMKLNAEVLVAGSCTAPQGKPVTQLVVEARVGAWSKGIAVVGRRAYSDRQGGGIASSPQPFTSMPLDYGHAYGGPGYEPNPGGRGVVSDEAPNLEWAGERLVTRSQKPSRGPAALGALNMRWAARAARLGKNYGAAWKKERAPFFADDFDWSYFHEAAADQQLRGYLRGDEPFELVNLHPTMPRVAGTLPGIRPRFFARFADGRVRDVGLTLDTVVVLADVGRLRLSWRGLVEVDDSEMEDVQAVVIATEPLGAPRPESDYRVELDRAKEGSVPIVPPDLVEQRDDAQAQLEAMRLATEAARTGEKAPGVAIVDQLVATMPKDDPRVPETRQRLLAALAEHDAHVPADKQMLAKLVPGPDQTPSPPPIRDLVAGEAPKMAPNRKLAAGIDDAIAEVKAAEPHLAHDPKGDGPKQSRQAREQLEALKVDPRFGPVFKPRALPGPGLDLSDQDLEGEDLRGANLEGANLEGTILTRADLTGANLRGARLVSAVLFRTVLDGADLEGAWLSLANFTECRGVKASLRRARLDRTFFENAQLDGADFSGATGVGGFFDGTRLVGAAFGAADIERTRFQGARLAGATFAGAKLTRVGFEACDLAGATFDEACLATTSFLHCDASRATFRRAAGASTSFQESRLDAADFTLAVLPGALMPRASLVGATLLGADLRNARLGRANLDGASFDRANLADADLRKTSCRGTSFRDASLFSANLLGAAGAGASFAGANLKRCQIEGMT